MDIQPSPAAQHPEEPGAESPTRREPFPWRLFWLLAMMMLLASLLLMPYALQLATIGNPALAERSGLAWVMVTVSTMIQTILIYWPLGLAGLLVSRRLGLGLPYLSALIEGRALPGSWRRVLALGIVTGFFSGVAVLLLSGILAPLLAGELVQMGTAQASLPNAWQGLMASISAGINEEILLRLFLLSLLAWVLQRLFLRRSAGMPPRAVLWTANILAAVIFGLLHIPNLSTMGVPVTPLLVTYLILLNGAAGLVFGWLYWKFGLECAMLAHFSADIVLHVLIVPLQTLAR